MDQYKKKTYSCVLVFFFFADCSGLCAWTPSSRSTDLTQESYFPLRHKELSHVCRLAFAIRLMRDTFEELEDDTLATTMATQRRSANKGLVVSKRYTRSARLLLAKAYKTRCMASTLPKPLPFPQCKRHAKDIKTA